MIIIIDNYDSFTYNLFQLVRATAGPGVDVRVLRNDVMDIGELAGLEPSHVVLSPGPGHPDSSRLSLAAAHAMPDTPVLGVCLGHQALAVAYGGRVVRARSPTHGRAMEVRHDGTHVFSDVDNPMHAALYHSLAVSEQDLPAELVVSARTPSGDIMGLRHTRRPHYGVQFHPESFLTPQGSRLLKSFLEIR